MKTAIVILASLALPAAAQILATFETDRGDVVVELQYDKTPKTVANFITLAEGTRSSYDPATGAVRPKRYYVGESFYRVVDNTGFKIAQTGSGTGTNSGGPGYTFRDEILLPTLKHDPYVLAMANGGPNTNGSQVYFTGSDAIADLDGKHTVFGLVTDSASQGVIDQIIAAGDNGTTIDEVSIQRIGATAQAFDEFAWSLPTCQAVPGHLSVEDLGGSPGAIYNWNSPLPTGARFNYSTSTDLGNWSSLFGFWTEDFPGSTAIALGDASAPRRFFNISLTTYPGYLRQRSLAERTMILFFPGGGTITLTFGETSGEGIMTLSTFPGQNYPFTSDYNSEAYGGSLVAFPVLAWPFAFPLDVRCGFDSENATEVTGRHTTALTNGQGLGSGLLFLDK